jgi:ankyrin repeat protein
MVDYLIEIGVSIDDVDEDGNTPSQYAKDKKQEAFQTIVNEK